MQSEALDPATQAQQKTCFNQGESRTRLLHRQMSIRLPQAPLQGTRQERGAGVFPDGLGKSVPSPGCLLMEG